MENFNLEKYIPLFWNIAKAVLILIVGWTASKWGNKLTLKAFRSRNVDEALGRFIGNIIQYAILAAVFIAALGAVGVQTTSLVAIFASAGLAIGLALQGSLGNLASGVMILFFRPFNLGDKITGGGHTGKVEDIGLFATTLITPDNKKIIIPNNSVTGGAIINYSAKGTLRGCIEVGVAYGGDVEKVITVLEQAAKDADLVLSDPAPAVAFVGLGASSLDFNILVWSVAADYLGMLHNVRHKAYDALNKEGIEIPFNQIVVHQAQEA